IPGHPAEGGGESTAHMLTISETFFSTLGVALVSGRDLRLGDAGNAPKAVVVNMAFARKFFPGEAPVGKTLKRDNEDWHIVGVCRDMKYSDIKEEAPPTVYLSFRQKATGSAYFALRTSLPPLGVATAARGIVASLDPDIPVTDLHTQSEILDSATRQQWLFATLCSLLAVLALTLCCIGLYGLMAYHVSRTTVEIGIRMALGATRGLIAGRILREAMVLTGIGVALGVPLVLVLTRFIQSSLYGVAPSDPATLCGAVFFILAISLLAAGIPARLAAKIEPIEALRHE
ncbi:MAG TPA: FtsX-like permease family protein, partial [Verrucomicrobiae bacterium]|nr:FtsX-like permease family protein [Verrucomicrobiae bacterium]